MQQLASASEEVKNRTLTRKRIKFRKPSTHTYFVLNSDGIKQKYAKTMFQPHAAV